ncbi:MAG: ubiquinone biosynthesis accessory factor UbiJ [Wenzhouxiangellaceae bacterium]
MSQRYVTPLPGMLATVIEFVFNRAAALDERAAERLAPLEGRWLKFELQGLDIDLWIGADGPHFRVLAEVDDGIKADTVVTGTPGALIAMALPGDGGGSVRIDGDARLAQRFQAALVELDPDIERALSEYFGELIGPQMYRVFRDATRFGRDTARGATDQVSRWLRDESDLVPGPGEWREFSDGVDRLREAVDRLDRKVRSRE